MVPLSRFRYVLIPHPTAVSLTPGVRMGRMAILEPRRGGVKVSWEDPVLYEYDPAQGRLTLLQDKYGDGACCCLVCQRLYWSLEDERKEREKGHRAFLRLPEQFCVQEQRPDQPIAAFEG